MQEKELSFEEFERAYSVLQGQSVGFAESNGYTIDLFFGEFFEKPEDTGDLALFVSGEWRILEAGKTILANDAQYDKEDIIADSAILQGQSIASIKFVRVEREVLVEFENGYILQAQSNSANGWIELLSKNGDLFFADKDGHFLQKKYNDNGA